ncbi:MAG: T9SS type A sorting domain-containing protein [Ignavibacteriota bacterium]
MKKLFFILLVVFLSETTYGQLYYYNWNPITSPVTANLNTLVMYGNDMLIAGNGGTCFLLNSAGTNWTSYNTASSADFNSLNINSSYFLGGNNGIILKTAAPGNNWTYVSLPVTQNVNCVSHSIGANYKMACGDNGILYYTTTGGTNWYSLNSNTTNNLRNIYYNTNLSNSRSYLCGDNGTFRKIIFTFPPIPPVITIFTSNTGFANNFNFVTVLGNDTNKLLMAGSGGIIVKSTNGGANWVQQVSGTTKNLRFMYVSSENEIYACGDQGTVLRTTNGGTNWGAQVVNSNADLRGLAFVNNTAGYSIGSGGTILRTYFPNPLSDTSIKRIKLDGNNISAYFQNTGIFDQNSATGNTAGFEWPKDAGRTAIFTSGLSMSAIVNGQLRQAMCSYKGEYWPGQIINGTPQTPQELNKIWKVSAGDNCNNSVDFANWGLIVPYGAPYRDMNNNGVYDPCIDIPGVKNATQTIFMALTDGFAYKHSPGEGFGGGTLPMNADMKITAWTYGDTSLTNVQYMRFDVINRGSSAWNNLYFALIGDPDLGDANDDYLAMDSTRNMWICYNGDNYDGNGAPPTYGAAPPALGMRVIKFPVNKTVTPFDTIYTSSGSYFTCTSCSPPPCESDPNGQPLGAYNMMKGFKKDGSKWMNPTFTPPRPVKFVFGGEPEPNTGWTEPKGSIRNCGGDTGVYVPVNAPGDRRYILGMGKDNFTMNPGDSQSIVVIQLIARGSNNLNSVTLLKQLSDIAANYTVGVNQIGTTVPGNFSLSQNYPNPFNPETRIKFAIPSIRNLNSNVVILRVFDMLGKEIATLVNDRLSPGVYEVAFDGNKLSSGMYFYKLQMGEYSDTKRMVLLK